MKSLLAAVLMMSFTALAQQFPEATSQGQPALLALPYVGSEDAPQLVIGNVFHSLERTSVDQMVMLTIGQIYNNPNIPTYVVNRSRRFYSVRIEGQCLSRQRVVIAGTAAYRDVVQPLNGQCPHSARLRVTNLVPVQPNEITAVGDAAVVSDNRSEGKEESSAGSGADAQPAASAQ